MDRSPRPHGDQTTESIAMTGVRLEVIHTAEISTPHGYVFRARGNRLSQLRAGFSKRGEMLRSPCLAYVIHHPTAGVLLIDTGLHPDASSDLRKDFGVPMSLLFSGIRPDPTPFTEQLRSAGVEPDEVERVVMTHLHVDHTSGMRLLPNATFICTRQEWAAAHGRLAAANGYVAHHLPPTSRTHLIDFTAEGEPHLGFERSIDLLGDRSVRLLFTPGHTRGHQSVLVRLEDGRQVLVVGDAAYTVRSIEEELLPMLTADDEASRRTLRQLHAFTQEHPQAIVVPTHDPNAWRALAGVGQPGTGDPGQPSR